MRRLIRHTLKALLYPVVILFAPAYYFAARSGLANRFFRRMGFELVLVNYNYPIPEYESLPDAAFSQAHPLPGIDWNDERFATELEALGTFAAEIDWPEHSDTPGEYYGQNPTFGYSSAMFLYTMLRHYKTRNVIEVGSGFSTLVSLMALRQQSTASGKYQLTCIEPYPPAWLPAILQEDANHVSLLQSKVQDLSPEIFETLHENDLLFIDSTHVAKLNSDVNFLFLQIIPRLRPGVLIHIHDVYLPYEYPRINFEGWPKAYWNEQYLLQSLLIDNHQIEILLPGYYVQRQMTDRVTAAFPGYDPARHRPTSSFWMRKTSA